MLLENEPSTERITAWRAMTGQERLKVAQQMYWAAPELKNADMRRQHPEWSYEKVKLAVNQIYLEAAVGEDHPLRKRNS
jgi:hypothetical protein